MQPADTRPSHALPRHWLRVGIALVIVLVLHRARRVLADAQPRRVHAARARHPIQIELLKPQPIERQPAPLKPVEPPAARRRPRTAAPKPAPEPVLTSTQTAEHGEPPPRVRREWCARRIGRACVGCQRRQHHDSGATNGVKFNAPAVR